jgi:hypothetical protein
VLSRNVIFKLLAVLLYNQGLFTKWLISHVVKDLIKTLIVLLWEVGSHLLLMYQGSVSLIWTGVLASIWSFVKLAPRH